MTDADANPLLRVEGIVTRFGGVLAIDDVTFDVARSEILGVIGPNGAGKTTLLNVISGFVRAQRGRVVLGDVDLSNKSPVNRARQGIGRTFQTPRLFPGLTVEENLVVARRQGGIKRKSWLSIDDVLEFVRLESRRHVTSEHLTAGERRFAELARAIVIGPTLLLLDEPATGLRDVEIEILSETLSKLCAEHEMSCLLISHHMQLVNDCCANVLVMDRGRVITSGTPEDVRRDPAVTRAYFGFQEVVR